MTIRRERLPGATNMKLWAHPFLQASTEPVKDYHIAKVFNSIQNSMDGSGSWTALHLLQSDGRFVQGGWIPNSCLSDFNLAPQEEHHQPHETQWGAFLHDLHALMHRYEAVFLNGISDVETRFPTLRFKLPVEEQDMCWHIEVMGKRPEFASEEAEDHLYGNPFPDLYFKSTL